MLDGEAELALVLGSCEMGGPTGSAGAGGERRNRLLNTPLSTSDLPPVAIALAMAADIASLGALVQMQPGAAALLFRGHLDSTLDVLARYGLRLGMAPHDIREWIFEGVR